MTPPDTPRGEIADRRRQAAEATTGQRQIRRTQLQLSLQRLMKEGGGRSLAEISITEIAAGAGISAPSLYSYYATKEDLLRDAVDAQLGVLLGRTELAFRRSEDFSGYVTRLVDAVLAMWDEHPYLFSGAVSLATSGRLEYRQWWLDHLRPWADALRMAVEDARFAGELPTVAGNLQMLANIAAWSAQTAFQQVMAVPHDDTQRQVVRDSVIMAIRRMLGDPC